MPLIARYIHDPIAPRIATALFCALALATPSPSYAQSAPSPQELISKVSDAYGPSPPSYQHLEVTSRGRQSGASAGASAGTTSIAAHDIFRDGERFDAARVRSHVEQGVSKPNYGYRSMWLSDVHGQTPYIARQQYLAEPDQQIVVTISADPNSAEGHLTSPGSAPFLRGYLGGDSTHIDEVLAAATDTQVASARVNVDGNGCFKLSAQTPYGQYTLWIDPLAGYLVRRADVTRGPDDLYYGRTLREQGMTSSTSSVDSVEIELIKGTGIGIYVTTAGKAELSNEKTTGEAWTGTTEVRVSGVQWNPDFEAMGAFKMDGVPDGTLVFHREFPDIRYTWLGGRPVADLGLTGIGNLEDMIESPPSVESDPSQANASVSENDPEPSLTTEAQADPIPGDIVPASPFGRLAPGLAPVLALAIACILGAFLIRRFRR